MDGGAITLVALGVLFLASVTVDALAARTHVPRVTLLILLGILVGPPCLDVLPDFLAGTDELVAPMALTMVAFLLGGQLKPATLQAHGREILWLSLAVVMVSAAFVGLGLWLISGDPVLAILIAGVSAATDPAATRDVIRACRADGRFATNLLGIVAVDDAWGIILFSLMLLGAQMIGGNGDARPLLDALTELGGALVLGAALGFPAAYLTGRLKPGEPTLLEALGIVFLCTGLALWFDLPYLLSGMVCGAVIVHFAAHHERPFHEIERIEWPFMLLLFVMAGAALDISAVVGLGLVGVAYVALRFLARIVGGWLGAKLAGLPGREGGLTGLALMPQAGVAIGMALVASERFPDRAEAILGITIASTVIFEVIGPILTQIALRKSTTDPDRTQREAG